VMRLDRGIWGGLVSIVFLGWRLIDPSKHQGRAYERKWVRATPHRTEFTKITDSGGPNTKYLKHVGIRYWGVGVVCCGGGGCGVWVFVVGVLFSSGHRG